MSDKKPGAIAPVPRRKRWALPWGRGVIFLAAMTVVGFGVWVLVLKAIPILREEKEEKLPPPIAAHESRQFNYRLILPEGPWNQDSQVRLQLKANLLAMRRTNPTAWFALAARDYKTRMPRDSEVIEEAVSRLNGYFKNLEWESGSDGILACRKALRVVFHGISSDSTMEGECYILTYKGIAYWFTTWAPLRENPPLTEDFRKIRDGFGLLKERENFNKEKASSVINDH